MFSLFFILLLLDVTLILSSIATRCSPPCIFYWNSFLSSSFPISIFFFCSIPPPPQSSLLHFYLSVEIQFRSDFVPQYLGEQRAHLILLILLVENLQLFEPMCVYVQQVLLLEPKTVYGKLVEVEALLTML